MLDQILEGLTAFPHRSSTTPAEKRAADYLAAELEKLGFRVTQEPFTAPTTFSWIYFILYGGFALAITFHYFFPQFGFILAVVWTVLFVAEQMTWWSPISYLVPRGSSQNVLGRLAPETGENLLILVAHYDTSKTALAFSPGTVRYLRPLFLISLLMIVTTLLGTGSNLLDHQVSWSWRIWHYSLLLPLVYFVYAAALMVERELRGRPVPGAADNASGVAVVMDLASRLKEAGGIPGWRTWVLFTGCEEVGLAGMSAFLNAHGRELDKTKTVFLNFDNLGDGQLTYVTSEGMLKGLAADPELLRLAREISQREPFEDVQGRPFHALTLDTLVPRARGFRVLSFMSLNEFGVPWPWHWHDDVLENVDREDLDRAVEFAWMLLHRLAGKEVEGR